MRSRREIVVYLSVNPITEFVSVWFRAVPEVKYTKFVDPKSNNCGFSILQAEMRWLHVLLLTEIDNIWFHIVVEPKCIEFLGTK